MKGKQLHLYFQEEEEVKFKLISFFSFSKYCHWKKGMQNACFLFSFETKKKRQQHTTQETLA